MRPNFYQHFLILSRQMKALDYILYVIHCFLLIVKKFNNEDIEGRSKNTLAIMVFLVSLLLSAIVYSLCISNKWIPYNKTIIFFGIALFFLIRYFIFKRYKTQYYKVVETLKCQFSYSNKRIVFSFFILWFIPIFLLWIGVIIIRQFIH